MYVRATPPERSDPNPFAAPHPASQHPDASDPDPSPPELYRIAARDRAYGLLAALTRLGHAWDHSAAWLALARAYEEGGQVERAKQALWWTVELEDTRPVRRWEEIGPGGYVLR